MRNLICLLIFTAASVAGCGSTAVNLNVNVRNGNVNNNPPAANLSPAMPPPTMMPSNTLGGNVTHGSNRMPPPGTANEKMTPAHMPPGFLGTPVKKPTP